MEARAYSCENEKGSRVYHVTKWKRNSEGAMEFYGDHRTKAIELATRGAVETVARKWGAEVVYTN